MVRTTNAEKVQRVKPNTKTVVFTVFWLMLVAAALLFIGFAGHI